MSRRTRALVLVLSTPLVVLVLVGGLLGAVQNPTRATPRHLRVFDDVYRAIMSAYVEPANIDSVMDGAMRGLADGLDPLTAYLAPDEVRFVESGAAVPPADIGVTVSRQYYLKINGVRDGSPAAKAGLESGDFIRAIDGKPTRDLSAFAGTRLLHGAPGSRVELLVIRTNPSEPHTVTLERETPGAERASGRTLPGGEAYVRVSSFGPGAAAAIGTAIRTLGPATNDGVLIDLRDVADGAAAEGVTAARLFVKDGVLATRISRQQSPVVTRAASGDGALGMKVVLIVSNGTAQAAEVFAAALANNKRADLVGEPTAGLASVQQLVKLPSGYGLWMTAERFVQADKSPLDGRGLRPTVPVVVPTVEFGLPAPTGDLTLDKAVAHLHGRTPADEMSGPADARDRATAPDANRPDLPPTTPPQTPAPNRPLPSSPR